MLTGEVYFPCLVDCLTFSVRLRTHGRLGASSNTQGLHRHARWSGAVEILTCRTRRVLLWPSHLVIVERLSLEDLIGHAWAVEERQESVLQA